MTDPVIYVADDDEDDFFRYDPGPEYWASVREANKQDARAKKVMDELLHGLPEWPDFDDPTEKFQKLYDEHKSRLNALIREHLDADSLWSLVFLAGDFRESNQGANKARQRHRADPKHAAKMNVRDCWLRWQKNPREYRSKSAFARAMLDKYEVLGSQRVIERWCKEWEAGPCQQDTY